MEQTELKLASMGLDNAYSVEVASKTINDTWRTEDRYKAVINETTGKVACIAGKNYKIIQHRDAVESVLNALNNLNLPYTGHIMNGGNKVIVDIDFPKEQLKLEKVGEEFMAGISIVNSYDRTTGLSILPRMKRLACMNGMTVNLFYHSFHVKHTYAMTADIAVAAQKVINQMANSNANFKQFVEDSIGDSIAFERTKLILNALIPVKKHRMKINEILAPDAEKGYLTRWDLYNAITNYATHNDIAVSVNEFLQKKAQKVLKTMSEDLPVLTIREDAGVAE